MHAVVQPSLAKAKTGNSDLIGDHFTANLLTLSNKFNRSNDTFDRLWSVDCLAFRIEIAILILPPNV